ncbi:CPX chromosomal region candidate gene 1 protein-like [Camelus dromedarius]|uniref:CPX chromosomal region candidate gene 1 protein-like n=1 Tax=Camelus dromedarius TaxID=9838 RepID=UPI00311A2200
MASPTKEGSDPADSALKILENGAPNDCSTDIEPSFADSIMISQVESHPASREQDTPTCQGHAVPQAAENNKLSVEKLQKDSQKEGVKRGSLFIQIPTPRKWILLIYPLTKGARLGSGEVEVETSDFCHHAVNYRVSLQFSISWRIPFINSHEIRMALRLLCRRHFWRAAGRQNTVWVKPKYTAFLPHPNVLTHGERTTIFGRPLNSYHCCPLAESLTSGKFSESTDAKGKDGVHILGSRALVALSVHRQTAVVEQLLPEIRVASALCHPWPPPPDPGSALGLGHVCISRSCLFPIMATPDPVPCSDVK